MKTQYCLEEKTYIDFDGECNWCGETEMTQDEIIRMALEAGWDERLGFSKVEMPEFFERFAALVAAHEREACAVYPSWDTVDDAIAAEREACAEACLKTGIKHPQQTGQEACAAAIRARSEK